MKKLLISSLVVMALGFLGAVPANAATFPSSIGDTNHEQEPDDGVASEPPPLTPGPETPDPGTPDAGTPGSRTPEQGTGALPRAGAVVQAPILVAVTALGAGLALLVVGRQRRRSTVS